jgi:tRNA pseudouridine55 synthase
MSINQYPEFKFEEGEVFLIDKPYTYTSFDAVNKLRYRIKKITKNKKIKVGHAGTLDPLATGLLIICTGKKTKTIDEIQAQTKEYTGEIELGKTTPSFDLETVFNQEFPTTHITPEMLDEVRNTFLGEISQRPPVFSAVKVDGKRSYELARKGKEVEIQARQVTIESFDIDPSNFPIISFRIVCSKGTYIRSIANDFGERCQSGSYLKSLRRTKIGDFDVAHSYQIDDFVGHLEKLIDENP